MQMPVSIRPASPTDAERIVAVHFAAVHQTAAESYPPEILDVWSAAPGEARFNRLRQWIAGVDEVFIVAEVEGEIVGFGSIAPAANQIRAVYVDPAAARRGVGAAILSRLEVIAAEHGVKCILVNASLNAEGFYRNNGYEVEGSGAFRLNAAVEMACVKMRKNLKLRVAGGGTVGARGDAPPKGGG